MDRDTLYSRRIFVRRMGLMLGVGVVGGTVLVACGDEATATTAAQPTIKPTAAPATTAPATPASTATVKATPAGLKPNDIDLGAVADLAKLTEPKPVTIGDSHGFVTVIKGKVGVLSAICTHKGCDVAWDGVDKQYKCPCHGSVYDAQGFNIGGPAPKPLNVIPARVIDGHLVVYTTT